MDFPEKDLEKLTPRQRDAKATEFLRSQGFTWAGNSKKEARPSQALFERRLICTSPPGSGKKRR